MRSVSWAGVVLVATAFAASPSTETWKIAGKDYVFERVANGALVDTKCGKNPTQCVALERLPTADLSKIKDEEREGGKNPGGILCAKFFKGTVVMGRDSANNRSSFCLCEDGSMIDNGSIYEAAAKAR